MTAQRLNALAASGSTMVGHVIAVSRSLSTVDARNDTLASVAMDDVSSTPEINASPGKDTRRTLKHQKWLSMPPHGAGIVVHDVHRQED